MNKLFFHNFRFRYSSNLGHQMNFLNDLHLERVCGPKCQDNIIFSIGPLTALIAAKFGVRTWLAYEIVGHLIFASVQFFKPEFFMGIFVSI